MDLSGVPVRCVACNTRHPLPAICLARALTQAARAPSEQQVVASAAEQVAELPEEVDRWSGWYAASAQAEEMEAEMSRRVMLYELPWRPVMLCEGP